MTADLYRDATEAWRAAYEARLLAPEGWFSAVGLEWLEGEALEIGGETGNGVGGALATVRLERGALRLQTSGAAPLRVAGRSVSDTPLTLDARGDSERIELGERTLRVIRRSGRIAVRWFDENAPARRDFAGLRWFPVDPAWRVAGRFEPYPSPRTVEIADILGQLRTERIPGAVAFELAGRTHRLLPTESEGGFFFVFRDATSDANSYPTGRFLHASRHDDDRVELDFNRAHNPPCAYTAHATCPLPLPENRLPAAIPAGEQRYRAGPG